jgi:methylmalonyl-CoA mutase
MAEPLALAAEFPPADRATWAALVGDPLPRSYDNDGIALSPLYTAADVHQLEPGLPGRMPFVRGATAAGAAAWDVRVRHADPDEQRTTTAVRADLAGGATSVWLVLGAGGLPLSDLTAVLAGVDLDVVPVVLDAGTATAEAADRFLDLLSNRDVATDGVRGSLGADPIGWRARTGASADLELLPDLAERIRRHPRLRVATVDATAYHDAGGSSADEVAAASAVGVAYLRALTAAGLPIDRALSLLEFRFAATADQFGTVMKLRAARRVWARIGELCGAAPERRGQRQHAVTSAPMMSRRDPWANMLRTTIACFAAAIGSAEAITVRPFDEAIGLSDQFARRLARNAQAILHDEASLGRVLDPAGGSWYVETVTEQLAEAAWAKFTGLERSGGALRALDDGTLGELLARARAARAADIATRRAPIVGVSEFALPDETPLTRPPAPRAPAGGRLPFVRDSEPYEALRERSDRARARPPVFLAPLGPAASHAARVAFAAGVFRAGGFELVGGTGTPEELVTQFRDCSTSVACLCGSDASYVESAGSTAAALKAAGARYVWLAGRPGGDEGVQRTAGVDGYVYGGCDVLDVLRTTLDLLDVP